MLARYSTSSSDNIFNIKSFEDKDYADPMFDKYSEIEWIRSIYCKKYQGVPSILSINTFYNALRRNTSTDKLDWFRFIENSSSSYATFIIVHDETQSTMASRLSNIYFEQLENWGDISLPAESYYSFKVQRLPNLEAIIFSENNNIKYLTTILSMRDTKTREKIYDIELDLYDYYPDQNFYFIVDYISSQDQLHLSIKDKNVLYYKPPVHVR